MALVKSDELSRGQPDIYLVRRAQTSLAFKNEYQDLMRYYSRSAFEGVSKTLAKHYWPESVESKRAVVALVEELYVLWLILLPIACRHLGYWRPGWGSSIFLSWFREHIHRHKRYFLGYIKLNYHDAGIDEGFSEARIRDDDFKTIAAQYVDQCSGATARATMARIIFAPYVHWRQAAAAYTTAKERKCGLMWYEDAILYLSTRPWDDSCISWTDLRQHSVDLLFWRFSVKETLLDVSISKTYENAIKAEIAKTLSSEASPIYKLHQINSSLIKYYHWGRYATGARAQAIALDKWTWKRVGAKIVSTNPKLKDSYYNLRKQKWDLTLRQGRRSLILDKDTSDEQWRQIWSPRRG